MKYTIYGYFGRPSLKINNNQTLKINLLNSNKKLRFNIETSIQQLSKLDISPSEIAIDLLLLSILTHIADTKLNRYTTSENSWSREINIILPVSNIVLWDQSKQTIIEMLNFLTGDFWDITFIERPKKYKSFIENPNFQMSPYKKVSLFSGGLDSLIGMIDILEKNENVIFVSSSGESKVSNAQKEILYKIKNNPKYKNIKIERLRFPNFHVSEKFKDIISIEKTTRGRSFLFLSLGVFVGSGIKNSFELSIPENGFIALNIPLDVTRVGALTTRTTHPYYLWLWNKLLISLHINATINNPYWNKTKGEMIKEVKNKKILKELLPISISCSHPSQARYMGINTSHCGHCVPCIIRRASILYALGKKDPTKYILNDIDKRELNSKKAEGIQIRSFQYAINRINKNPDIVKALVFEQGPLTQDIKKLKGFINVYLKGMKEVEVLLKNVTTKPS